MSYIELHTNEINESTVDSHGQSLIKLLRAAVEVAILHTKTSNQWVGRQPWWINELNVLKKALERSRQLGQQTNAHDIYRGHRNKYLQRYVKPKWLHCEL